MNEQTHSSKSSVSYSNHNLVSKSDGDSPTLTYSLRVEAATGTECSVLRSNAVRKHVFIVTGHQ